MKTRFLIFFFCFAAIPFISCQTKVFAEPEIFIRANQVGFLPTEIKTAVVLSNSKLEGKRYQIKSLNKDLTVLSNSFGKNLGKYGNFNNSYRIDFSSIKTVGEYIITFGQNKSHPFSISENAYKGIADTLLTFFQVQRCGYTNPYMHATCHISDAAQLIDGKRTIDKKVDVTGGWHDAGDYVKILNTTAFSTYMLLFSYEFDPQKFSSDRNKNSVPDILEEAKVGLDWMLRAYFDKKKLITQVQDLRDHDVGWRMPEEDAVGYDRPAYVGMGKNLIGIYSATMALAYRIWNTKLNYPEFANQCLTAAQNLYSIHKQVRDVDSSGSGVYIDKNFNGKMALGAIELFISTNKTNYLSDATVFADSAKSDYWWSWGDINSLAHYRISKFVPRFSDYIKNNLIAFNNSKNKNLFGKGVSLSWGTNVTLLGITLQNSLYKKLTNDSKFDTVAVFAKDYILGRNQWGISFINNVGKQYSKNFHHQIAYLKGKLPGGFSAGPATQEYVDKAKLPFEKPDQFLRFQTNESYYRDDRNDYITNEPTITGNATAIFVFGTLLK